ncbi:MAG: hypothetical protein R3E68_01675 [Burkholderiaceae bacterium]
MLTQQRDRAHDLSGLAIAALWNRFVEPGPSVVMDAIFPMGRRDSIANLMACGLRPAAPQLLRVTVEQDGRRRTSPRRSRICAGQAELFVDERQQCLLLPRCGHKRVSSRADRQFHGFLSTKNEDFGYETTR